MNEIANILTQNEKFKDIVKEIKLNTTPISILGLVDVAKTQFVSALLEQTNKKICIITYNEIQAKNLLKNLNYFNKKVVYFPKKEVVLKQNIEKTMYSIIEDIFSYRIEDTNRIKLKYLKSLLIQISMLDYYMQVSYKKKIISPKKYISVSNFLIEMKKISYGVIKSEKKDT